MTKKKYFNYFLKIPVFKLKLYKYHVLREKTIKIGTLRMLFFLFKSRSIKLSYEDYLFKP